MTATFDLELRRQLLLERRTVLEQERDEALADLAPVTSGDDADRATNVEAHLRLAMIDKQLATIAIELDVEAHIKARADVVEIGDVVTIDFGDGAEQFLLGPIEHRGDGLDVITPASPLGRALIGTSVGASIDFHTSQRTLRARVIAAA